MVGIAVGRMYFSRFNLDHHLIKRRKKPKKLRFEKGPTRGEIKKRNF